MKFSTLKDMDIENKKVLVRVDYNVPIKNGMVEDDTRLKATIPTINYLLEKKCKIILMSHLGRPQKLLKKGKAFEEIKKELTLKPVAEDLSDILGISVGFVSDCIDVEIPQDNDVLLLENLRLHKEEESNNEEFAKKLSKNGQIFINDAFGNCHRNHASVSAITKFMPSCAGFLVEKEINHLSKLLNPERPFVSIVAGAKADKIGALKVLAQKADKILIGGVLANTFLKAKGNDIGSSKFDEETFSFAEEIINTAGKKLIFPIDTVIADKFDNNADTKIANTTKIEKEWISLDIGPETIKLYKEELKEAKTVLWAGPLGVFEMEKFSKGTKDIGEFLTTLDAEVIAGGGDTAAAVQHLNLGNKISHVSTGGGASLEFIEKDGKLPALVALEKAYERDDK
ncbi:phosphoglycerate kinase [archaeon]|nr:phosphoglycerate kinase [archaeon]MDP6547801.1 phosphoglycerate kinase [Candidatus Woesearchaeota archaeon]